MEPAFWVLGSSGAKSGAPDFAPLLPNTLDLLWCETSEPNLSEAKRFAEGVHDDVGEQAFADIEDFRRGQKGFISSHSPRKSIN